PCAGSMTTSTDDAGTITRARSVTVVPGSPRISPDDDGSRSTLRLLYAGKRSVASRSPTSGTLDSCAPSNGAAGADTSPRQPSARNRGATTASTRLPTTATAAHHRARVISSTSISDAGSSSTSRSEVVSISASTSSGDGEPTRGGASASSTDDS